MTDAPKPGPPLLVGPAMTLEEFEARHTRIHREVEAIASDLARSNPGKVVPVYQCVTLISLHAEKEKE